MYFVAYLPKIKRNIILPLNWVKDIDDHIEKFMNYGVNSSQTFLCFYTNDPAAFDGNIPQNNFVPKFNSRMRGDLNGDGCFITKLKKYNRKYEVDFKFQYFQDNLFLQIKIYIKNKMFIFIFMKHSYIQ